MIKIGQPEKRFWISPCSASVFANEIDTEDGKATVRTVTLQKFFKNAQGDTGHTNSFGVNDIPKAQLALKKAWEYLVTADKAE